MQRESERLESVVRQTCQNVAAATSFYTRLKRLQPTSLTQESQTGRPRGFGVASYGARRHVTPRLPNVWTCVCCFIVSSLV